MDSIPDELDSDPEDVVGEVEFLDESTPPPPAVVKFSLEDEDDVLPLPPVVVKPQPETNPHWFIPAGCGSLKNNCECRYCHAREERRFIDGHLASCFAKKQHDKQKADSATMVVKPAPTPVAPDLTDDVNCTLPHCIMHGPVAGMAKHEDTRNHKCRECYKMYHTVFERDACALKDIEDYNASNKAEKEARWASLSPSQRRTEWEKDKQDGMRNGSSAWGRWRKGEKFND
jgi:hypothetical protein